MNVNIYNYWWICVTHDWGLWDPFFSFDFFGFSFWETDIEWCCRLNGVGLKMIDISEFNRIWMRIWWMTWECQMKESGGWCGQSWLYVCMYVCGFVLLILGHMCMWVSFTPPPFLLGYWIIWRWIFLLVELLIKNDLYEIVN